MRKHSKRDKQIITLLRQIIQRVDSGVEPMKPAADVIKRLRKLK